MVWSSFIDSDSWTETHEVIQASCTSTDAGTSAGGNVHNAACDTLDGSWGLNQELRGKCEHNPAPPTSCPGAVRVQRESAESKAMLLMNLMRGQILRLSLVVLCIFSAVMIVKEVTMFPAWVKARSRDSAALMQVSSGEHTQLLPASSVYRALAPRAFFLILPAWLAPVLFLFVHSGLPKKLLHGALVYCFSMPTIAMVVFMFCENANTIMGLNSVFGGTDSRHALIAAFCYVVLVWCPNVCGALLWQRLYGTANAFRVEIFRAAQLTICWFIFLVVAHFLLPYYLNLSWGWLILASIVLNRTRDFICRINFGLVLSQLKTDNEKSRDLNHNEKSRDLNLKTALVTGLYFGVSVMRHAAQLTSFSTEQLFIVLGVSTIAEVHQHLRLLQGKPPGQLVVDIGMGVKRMITYLKNRFRLASSNTVPVCNPDNVFFSPNDSQHISREAASVAPLDLNDGGDALSEAHPEDAQLQEEKRLHQLCVVSSLDMMSAEAVAVAQVLCLPPKPAWQTQCVTLRSLSYELLRLAAIALGLNH